MITLALLKQRVLLLRHVDLQWRLRLCKDAYEGLGDAEDVRFTVVSGEGPDGDRRFHPYREMGSAIGHEDKEFELMARAFEESLSTKDLPEKMRAFLGTLAQLHRDLARTGVTEQDWDNLREWEYLLFMPGVDWPKE